MKLVICDFNKTLYDPTAQQLFPCALEMLEYFQKSGIKLALLSTEMPDRARLLDKFGMATYFEQVHFVIHKTASSIQAIVDASGVAMQDVLIIGDDPEGELLVAQQLHIPAVAVGTGFCDKQAADVLGATFCASVKDVLETQL